MLMVQRPELLSPHSFVLIASVGMLCARVPHCLEKRPMVHLRLELMLISSSGTLMP